MNKYIFIYLIAIISVPTFGQNLGTIKVNENYSATCEFNKPVSNIYISNNELTERKNTSEGIVENKIRLYDYIIDGHTVIFSTYKKLQAKSLTIKLIDGSTWYGMIEYDPENKQIFYPYASRSKKSKKTETEQKDSLRVIKDRLSYCTASKTNFEGFGVNKNRIYWEISNIMADENFIYLKILVSNKSGHVYDITNGKALFKYEEGKSRNLKKKEASVEVDGLVVYHKGKGRIAAYSNEVLGYVIQSYPLNSNGTLTVNFFESSGKRNYEIVIPFKYMEKIEVFND